MVYYDSLVLFSCFLKHYFYYMHDSQYVCMYVYGWWRKRNTVPA